MKKNARLMMVVIITIALLSFGYFLIISYDRYIPPDEYALNQYEYLIEEHNAIRYTGSSIKNESNYEITDINSSTEIIHERELTPKKAAKIAQYNAFVNDYNSRMKYLHENQEWLCEDLNFPRRLKLYSLYEYLTVEKTPPLVMPKRLPTPPEDWHSTSYGEHRFNKLFAFD
jgi:hypothetical protein